MREARRAAVVLASLALAGGWQAVGARADSGGSSPGACSGSGNLAIGNNVLVALPVYFDPATHQPELRDAFVCTHVSGGATDVVDATVVVPAPDDQGANLAQAATCTATAAGLATAACAALAQPLVTVAPPSEGGNELGVDVAIPLTLCMASNCGMAAAAPSSLAGGVLVGMAQCTPPPDSPSTVPNAGAVCTWRGAQLFADGVEMPVFGADTAGAWLTPHADAGLGFASIPAGCTPDADPSGCSPQPEDPYAWVRDNGGRQLLLVVGHHRVPVVLPLGAEACVYFAGAEDC